MIGFFILNLSLLTSCGSEEDSGSSSARKFTNGPGGNPSGDTTPPPPAAGTEERLSQNVSLAPMNQRTLSLPAEQSAFCSPTTAQWSIVYPAGATVTNLVELQDAQSCSPKVKLLAGYVEATGASLVGRFPKPNNITLIYSFMLHIRLAPVIVSPGSTPIDLNANFPMYTHSAAHPNGVDYNCDGQKMRFLESGGILTFRDSGNGGCAINNDNPPVTRSFDFDIQVQDPSQYEPRTGDFSYSLECSAPNVFHTGGACDNYCPFSVSVSDQQHLSFSFMGAVANGKFQINRGECWFGSVDNGSPITVRLKVRTGGGQLETIKDLAVLKVEVD